MTPKKRILLIYPKLGHKALKPQSPLALLTLCPGLEEAGYEPVVVDTRVDPNFENTIRELLPDSLFVGITSMTGVQIKYAVRVAELVRSLAPDVPIVWGGVHATIRPEQTLADPRVDIVVAGEGEEAVVELADCLASGGDLKEVKSLHFHDENGAYVFTGSRPFMDMNQVKMPAWHLVDVSQYGEIGVQTGRGCPFGCRFCYNHKFNGRKWRGKDSKTVVQELKILKERYNVDHVTFYDDNFFSNLKRVREFCEEVIAAGLDIKWSTTCRADMLAKRMSDEFCQLIKKAGVHILYVGSESGSNRILKDVINKRITVDDILGMARTTKKHKLRVHTAFMAGFPDETEAERLMTMKIIDQVKAIDPDIYITTICIYTPYPGNPLFDEAVEYGFREPASLPEWSDLTFFNCTLPWLTKEDKIRFERIAFIVRFVFWHREIKERFIKPWQYPAYLFYRADALIRWKLRFFDLGPEWALFRWVVNELES